MYNKKLKCCLLYARPKRELSIAICDTVDYLEGILFSEINQTGKEKYCMIPLFFLGGEETQTNST